MGAHHILACPDAANLSSPSLIGANYGDANEADVLMLPRVLMTPPGFLTLLLGSQGKGFGRRGLVGRRRQAAPALLCATEPETGND